MTDYPRARANDPITSFQGAAIAERIAPSQCERVITIMREKPQRQWTSREIARCDARRTEWYVSILRELWPNETPNTPRPLDRYDVARRMTELERAGKVRRCAPVTCPVTGHQAIAWEVVDTDAQENTT